MVWQGARADLDSTQARLEACTGEQGAALESLRGELEVSYCMIAV